MRLTLGLQQSAAHHPKRVATIFENRRRTYAEVLDRVTRFAGGLAALGAKPGDRIAILALNSDSYFEAYYAILWAGCLAVPCNTRWAPAEHFAALADSEPTLLLVDQHFAQMIAALPIALRDRVVCLGEAQEQLAAEEIIARSSRIADHSGSGDTPAAIFYTGGTTGAAKGVILSHDNLIVNFLSCGAVEPNPRDSVYLHAAPMFHIADATALLGLTQIGATHVILPRFDPAQVVETIGKYAVNSLLLVPTMIGMVDQYLREHPQPLTGV